MKIVNRIRNFFLSAFCSVLEFFSFFKDNIWLMTAKDMADAIKDSKDNSVIWIIIALGVIVLGTIIVLIIRFIALLFRWFFETA